MIIKDYQKSLIDSLNYSIKHFRKYLRMRKISKILGGNK